MCWLLNILCDIAELFTFAAMRRILFIFSIMLSLLLNCSAVFGGVVNGASVDVFSISAAEDNNQDCSDSYCFEYVLDGNAVSLSEHSYSSSSVRSNKTGRRIHPFEKSLSRIQKSGKTMDGCAYYYFRILLHRFHTGTHSTQRYIHLICSLLL